MSDPGKSSEEGARESLLKQLYSYFLAHLDKLILTLAIAWALTCTSNSLWMNIPAAAAILLLLTTLCSGRMERRVWAAAASSSSTPTRAAGEGSTQPCGPSLAGRGFRALSPAEREAWRRRVPSKVIEYAWEKFSGSIVQQWIYSTWYAAITPDRELPAEVRHMLNTAFGEICSRAALVDVKALFVRDVCQVLCDNIELYRATQAAVGAEQLAALAPAARERALQREMRAMGNLHTAMCTPEGHYKFLQSLADGLLRQLLPGPSGDLLQLRVGSVLRELMASCVLRPVMMFCLPHSINKLILTALRDEPAPPRDPATERMLVDAAQRWELLGQGSLREETDAMHALFDEQLRQQRQQQQSQRGPAARSSPDSARPAPASGAAPARAEATSAPRLPDQLPRSSGRPLSKAPSAGHLGDASSSSGSSDSRPAALSSLAGRADGTTMQPELPGHTSSMHAQAVGAAQPSVSSRSSSSQLVHSLSHGAEGGGGSPRPASRHRSTRSDASEVSLRLGAAEPLMMAAAGEQQGHGSRHASSQNAALPIMSSSWHSSQPVLGDPAPGSSGSGQDGGAAAPQLASSWHAHHAPRASDTGSDASLARHGTPAGGGGGGGGRAAQRQGFVGFPRASVVAPETSVEGGFAGALRQYVMYKIRVTDGADEWTVTRRYRNFEALHTLLQSRCPQYRLLKVSPPAKRIFNMNSQDLAFVHQRRRELDEYLKKVLSQPDVALSPDVWHFLRPGPDAFYNNFSHSPLQQLFGSNALPPGAEAASKPPLPSAPPPAPDARPHAPLRNRRFGSATSDDFVLIKQGGGGGGSLLPAGAGAADGSAPRQRVGDGPAAPGGGGVDGEASQDAGWVLGMEGGEHIGPAFVGVCSAAQAQGNWGLTSTTEPGPVGAEVDHRRQSATEAASRPSPSSSPPSRSPVLTSTTGAAAAAAATPSAAPTAGMTMSSTTATAAAAATHNHARTPGPDTGGGGGEAQRRGSVGGVSPQSTLEERQAQYAEALGASDPLLDVVDVVFQLQNRGFLWRQASTLARQTLSLLAGDAIDRFLILQIKALTSELSVARMILALQSALWPGGVWFAWANAQQQQRAEAVRRQEQQAEREGQAAGSVGEQAAAMPALAPEPWIPTWTPAPPMQPEKFLEPSVRPPDEAEMAQKVLDKLNSKAPLTLVRILGQKNYATSIKEIHVMLQSTTFTLQIGYGVLEAVIKAVFPELAPLVNRAQ